MSKWDERILVVNRKDLFDNEKNAFYGFIEKSDEKVSNIVNKFLKYEVKRRGDMEEDQNFKQLIGYVVVKDKLSQDILVYSRLEGGGEARLHGKSSVGIGGHMNEIEKLSIYDMLKENCSRELYEEIGIDYSNNLDELTFIGLINDDKVDVGKVHLGVVYICEVDKKDVKVLEKDTLEIKWLTPEQAKNEENYETWSEFLKPIF